MPDACELSSFYVDGLCLGIEVQAVQEAIRQLDITRVPLSPPHVAGLVNLRGQILTAIDLRYSLNMQPRLQGQAHVNLIIRSEDTLVDILVDEIGDVLAPCKDEFESLPPTVRGRLSLSVRGVYKLRGELLWHLDIEGLLEDFSPVVSNLDPLDK